MIKLNKRKVNKMKKITALNISGVTVRKVNQLYCLNDLHKAAGGEKRHQIANWLRNDQAIDLIKLLESEELKPIETILGKGKDQGTYACKELVYAYAMWISPKFNLSVIRAYDLLVNNEIAKARDESNRQILKDEYLPMTDAIKHSLEIAGKEPKFYHYSNEADLINRIITGMSAKQYKELHNCESVRDNLTPEGKEAMISLQRANASMIEMGDDFAARKDKLGRLLARRWNKRLIDKTITRAQLAA